MFKNQLSVQSFLQTDQKKICIKSYLYFAVNYVQAEMVHS